MQDRDDARDAIAGFPTVGKYADLIGRAEDRAPLRRLNRRKVESVARDFDVSIGAVVREANPKGGNDRCAVIEDAGAGNRRGIENEPFSMAG